MLYVIFVVNTDLICLYLFICLPIIMRCIGGLKFIMSVHKEKKHYDVVVVGGGMSGVCAAIAAARHGARTAIIQNRSMFGGNASSEIRMHIVGASCHASKQNLSEGGILMEILLANKARNPNQNFSIWDTVIWEKVRYQENLDMYLNTNLDDAITEGNVIKSIICHQNTTETEYEITAKIFIDATGHGTLGVLAGAISRIGSESRYEFNEPNAPEKPNNYTMGNTLLFKAIDRGRPVKFIKPFWAYTFTEEDLKHRPHLNETTAMADGGDFVEDDVEKTKGLPHFSTVDSGYWWIELGGKYDDIIKQAEDIRDELLKCVYGVWDHLKNCGDHGLDNYDLDWVGIVPGYRESRRLEGDYILTENDIRSNRIFDDAVAYGGWAMDEHTPGGIMDFDKLPSRIFNFEGCYTIPYRCYYSRNISNLMMAGRDISTSKMAFGSTRVMGTCAIGGQAAGTAAALAVKHNCTPRELGQQRIAELQQTLLRDDCFIPGFRNNDEKDLARQAKVTATSHIEGCGPENTINGISRTTESGLNYWESQPIGEKGESITFALNKKSELKEVRIYFDPNFTKEIMPSLTKTVLDRQVEGMPIELVRDYKLECISGEAVVYSREVIGNVQRMNILDIPEGIACDSVRITVYKTHGYPAARIFEVRIY